MTLILLICMTAAPDRCEAHRVALPGANEMTCLVTAQSEAARQVRPGWRVARYGCGRET